MRFDLDVRLSNFCAASLMPLLKTKFLPPPRALHPQASNTLQVETALVEADNLLFEAAAKAFETRCGGGEAAPRRRTAEQEREEMEKAQRLEHMRRRYFCTKLMFAFCCCC